LLLTARALRKYNVKAFLPVLFAFVFPFVRERAKFLPVRLGRAKHVRPIFRGKSDRNKEFFLLTGAVSFRSVSAMNKSASPTGSENGKEAFGPLFLLLRRCGPPGGQNPAGVLLNR
jgi:hypothetical protein